ncbi:DUF928 domain-containing protein [Leptolyngbya sp. FACHB-261]|nr:DUF928 domain-containing protein [Leptolyngbya sp. FACHB-261]
MQFALINHRFYNGRVTGIFNSQIETAVKQAQQRFRLQATGVVDVSTWNALLNTRVRLIALPSQGAPGLRQSAATRERCPRVNQPLTALIPSTNLALTVASHPTFWVYIPYSATPNNSVEFVLQDEQYQDLYRAQLPEAFQSPGIVSISLPLTEAPLETGKRYYWYFLVYCDDPERTTEPAFVTGTSQRISLDPTLSSQLGTAVSPWERVLFYTRRGLWSDALTTLAEFRRTEPEDVFLAVAWSNLLQDADLTELKLEPIVDCCTSSTPGQTVKIQR